MHLNLKMKRFKEIVHEFTDFCLYDEERDSAIITLDDKHFNSVKKELKKIGYQLVFISTFKVTMLTCVFIRKSK